MFAVPQGREQSRLFGFQQELKNDPARDPKMSCTGRKINCLASGLGAPPHSITTAIPPDKQSAPLFSRRVPTHVFEARLI
jgi:hypothetical protein